MHEVTLWMQKLIELMNQLGMGAPRLLRPGLTRPEIMSFADSVGLPFG